MSGLLLLWGAMAHTRGVRNVPRLWLLFAVILGIWLSVAIPLCVARPIIYRPVFVFLAGAVFTKAAGVGLLTAYLEEARRIARAAVGWSLGGARGRRA